MIPVFAFIFVPHLTVLTTVCESFVVVNLAHSQTLTFSSLFTPRLLSFVGFLNKLKMFRKLSQRVLMTRDFAMASSPLSAAGSGCRAPARCCVSSCSIVSDIGDKPRSPHSAPVTLSSGLPNQSVLTALIIFPIPLRSFCLSHPLMLCSPDGWKESRLMVSNLPFENLYLKQIKVFFFLVFFVFFQFETFFFFLSYNYLSDKKNAQVNENRPLLLHFSLL